MASSTGTIRSPASVTFGVTVGLYALWVACWLMVMSGVVPHYAIGPLVGIMTILMVGGPFVLAGLSIWCAVAMIGQPAMRTVRSAAAILVGIAGLAGFLLMYLFALAGASLI